MSGFVRTRRGEVVIWLAEAEASLISTLAAQLVELLRHDEPDPASNPDPLASMLDLSASVDPPSDPVLARLLPDAYPDDEEAAADFRRYTERGLRGTKVDNACAVMDSLKAAGLGEDAGGPVPDIEELEVSLGSDAAQAWLHCLTDLRLALATRLGVEQDDEEFWERLPDDDPRAHLHDIYSWLGYLQETLVVALSDHRR